MSYGSYERVPTDDVIQGSTVITLNSSNIAKGGLNAIQSYEKNNDVTKTRLLGNKEIKYGKQLTENQAEMLFEL